MLRVCRRRSLRLLLEFPSERGQEKLLYYYFPAAVSSPAVAALNTGGGPTPPPAAAPPAAPPAAAAVVFVPAEGLAEAVVSGAAAPVGIVGTVVVGARRIAVGKRLLFAFALAGAAADAGTAAAPAAGTAPGAATTAAGGATAPPTRGGAAPAAPGAAVTTPPPPLPTPPESPFTTGKQLFPHGLLNILPPCAGSAHLDTVASLAAPAAVPGATNRSTSASQPHPFSTKRRMSTQQASGGVCDIVMVTACSVAQSAVATEAPAREAAACKVLHAPDASVAAA